MCTRQINIRKTLHNVTITFDIAHKFNQKNNKKKTVKIPFFTVSFHQSFSQNDEFL